MVVTRKESAEKFEPQKGWKRVSMCNENEISIEHFSKPAGHSSPLHSHPNVQVLVVLKGELGIKTEKEEIILKKGDSVYIPGDEPHVVTNISDKVSEGLDIFVPGRSFDFWKKRKI